jgi:hypothetical protein
MEMFVSSVELNEFRKGVIYLMIPSSPVLPGYEEMIAESVFAKDQPQYLPLPSIIIPGPDGEVLTRWELTNEEKALLLSGGSIYLSIWTFGQPLQPIKLRVATPKMIVEEQRDIMLTDDNPTPDVSTVEDAPPS